MIVWYQVVLVQIPTCQNFQDQSTLDSWRAMSPGSLTEHGRGEGFYKELGGRAVGAARSASHYLGVLTVFPPEETPEQPKHPSAAG